MGKYRKKPVIINAEQWFENHTNEHVQKYVSKAITLCEHCNKSIDKHGYIKTLEGGHIVCPGDFIITGIKNEKYPCKPDIFEQTYELVEK